MQGVQPVKQRRRRPRIRFIPPPPVVKAKKKEREEKNEVLYRVDVVTGRNPDAATCASVSASRAAAGRCTHLNNVVNYTVTESIYARNTLC